MRPALLMMLFLTGCATVSTRATVALDAEVLALSKQHFARADAWDITGLEAEFAPAFRRAAKARVYDTTLFGQTLRLRAESGLPRVTSRTWTDELVRVSADTAIFTGFSKAEVITDAKGSRDTIETVQTLVWVREGTGWQLMHWASEEAGVEVERAAWNAMFKQAIGFNLKPNKFLMEVTRERAPGKALDVGVGMGRNALYLASKGWAVTGIDISDEGVRQTLAVAKQTQLTVDARVEDATKWDWGENQWDLVCLIYEGGADFVDKAVRALKPGGILVLEYFHDDGTKGTGIGGFKTGEVPKLFGALKTVRYEEVVDQADYGLSTEKLVRYVGQKP